MRRAGGVAAAFLPSRRWGSLERRVPVASSALVSGIVTFVAGGLTGTFGFLRYAAAQASALDSATLEIATRQLAHPGGPEVSSTTPMFVNAIAPFAFAFFTPLGWLSLYLAISGAARAVAAVVDDPFGDPILTGADAVATAIATRRATRRADDRRRALEGPEIPDRAVSGQAAAIPGADIVIVSSREKEGWTAGLVVMTGEKWFRLGEPVQRTVEGHLRTLYPLTEHKDLEAARRRTWYELPRSPQLK